MSRSRVAGPALLALVMGLALALRLWYVLALPGQGQDLVFSDMHAYDYTAWQLVRGLPVTGEPGLNGYHPLSASTYYYVGYTYFVAALYAMFGHDPAAIRVAQAVVGTLTVGAVYLLGSLCFGRRPGLVAATLTAVYLPLVYYAGLILTETWFLFLQMMALVLWLRAWGRGPAAGPALALVAGLVAGLTCLTRTTFVLSVALLAIAGWSLPPVPTPRRRRAALVAMFLMGAAAVIAPITARNYQIHGRFILISTNGPSTFVTGHVIHSTDLPYNLPPGINDADMAERHRKDAFRYLSEHLGEYLAEIPEFFEIIWTDNDFWPSTSTMWVPERAPGRARIDIQAHLKGSPPFGRVSYFPDLVRNVDRLVWCLIGLPMGALAVLFLPRSDRRWSVLYLALVPYLVIPFIAYAFSRYRLPAAPLVFILAGRALAACWDRRSRPEDAGDGAPRAETPEVPLVDPP
jgi:4-amino-4-deoxy-L-arabinose transferase-like glycosyltransferase